MAKVKHTADARVLGGVDISKHRHEVLISAPGKQPMSSSRAPRLNCGTAS